MVEEDAVGERRIEMPLIGQPGADLAMVDTEMSRFPSPPVHFAAADGEDLQIGLAECREQQEFPDIVQQAGQVGFVRPVIAGCGLVELLEIILGENLVRQIAQLHAAILENGLLAAAQRVFHDQSRRPLPAFHGLEVLVLAGLQQAVGERIELRLVWPEVLFRTQ
jgi:hypothetical protein